MPGDFTLYRGLFRHNGMTKIHKIVLYLQSSILSSQNEHLKVLSGENKGGPKLVSIDRYCYSVETLDILF
jgi:hypothetical protein